MLNLKELIDVGCAQTMVDSDGQIYPCSKPIVAIRHWPDYGEGDSYSGVCQQHSQQAGITYPVEERSQSTTFAVLSHL